ncbi:MAG: hypothetical protein Q8R29_01575 [bacterium]|nr:hypothetical protein [bacterium]
MSPEMSPETEGLTNFDWKEWPEAERLVHSFLAEFLLKNEFAKNFSERLLEETSTNFIDWVDHIVIGGSLVSVRNLQMAGYCHDDVPLKDSMFVLYHPNARLPRIAVNWDEKETKVLAVAIKCDELSFFSKIFKNRFGSLARLGFIEGSMWGPYCRVAVLDNSPTFLIAQRRGYGGIAPVRLDPKREDMIRDAIRLWHLQRFRYPAADYNTSGLLLHTCEKRRMREVLNYAEGLVKLVGSGMAAEIVMADERYYWQKRNAAAHFQKERQDKLGLGWGNHDHHTFRSSRKHFRTLVKIFETLGFQCRERFHAGCEAGWGAQILDHPESDAVIFADVDLSPEEVLNDFAHEPLKSRKELGTIGLWCALHGESIMQAGMHHLEIQCNFDRFRQDFVAANYKLMNPFSDLPMLRQAFTEGERWPVPDTTLHRLLKAKKITEEQFVSFKRDRAVGSHLEHLWRGGGYKGFNQKGISQILLALNPGTQKGS